MINEAARNRFAEANGWRFTRNRFSIDALARRLYSGGEFDDRLLGRLARVHGRDGYGTPTPFDHRENFRFPKSNSGRPVAILAHNYEDWDTDRTRELVADLGGSLELHEPPAGKRASWYYPGATLPQLITRPGCSVVWPTEDEMTEFAATYQRARQARHPDAGTYDPFAPEPSGLGLSDDPFADLM